LEIIEILVLIDIGIIDIIPVSPKEKPASVSKRAF